MRHQVSRDLFAYWNGLRGERPAPDRVEIDLGAIRGLLADSFVLETGADGVYPLRIAGTRVEALWGRDRKGFCYCEFWRPADRHGIAAGLATVIAEAAPLVAGARLRAPGDACLELELLLLPLRHFGRTPARVMGALSPLHTVDWLGQVPAGPLEMISMRRIAGETRPLPPSPAGKRPRLLVHEGGRP